ncbi:MAG TPA: inositol phosphorylceramide synthase [Bacteroidetes bacterium]|nr:inositol phosphorylceramide synthase [Bacteroidota bacterium]
MTFEKPFNKQTLVALGLSLFYLLWVIFVLGFRSDHLVFLALCLGLFFAGGTARKVIMALFFFIIYWVIYDSMRIYPNYEFNPVHIQEIYDLEKSLFGFEYLGKIVTPNEFFELNTRPAADVMSGLFYLSWVPVPLAFAVWLFFNDKRMLLDFSLAFLLANIFGFILYYAYPAAPPWYVEMHGFAENFSIPGNEAGLANFDRIMGIPIFHSMYAKNANVFAAIPSLHSAYPILPLYFAFKRKMWWAVGVFFIICLGIWGSAVYSRHHYIIDVLLGILCAVSTIFVLERLVLKTRVDGWLDRYAELIK